MIGVSMRRGEKSRANILEQECRPCLYLTGMPSQALTKNGVMVAGVWGMSGEIQNAPQCRDQFGGGLQKDLSGEWKEERTTPNLKGKVEKERGARRNETSGREKPIRTRQSYHAIIGQGVTASANMQRHVGTAMPDRKVAARIKQR